MSTELSLEKQEQKEILPFSPKNLWMLFFQPKTFFLCQQSIIIAVL